MEPLPPDLTSQVITYIKKHTENPEIAPNPEAFLKEALKRNNFLPADIQEEIDRLREKTPQKEYLMSHPIIALEFGRYEI